MTDTGDRRAGSELPTDDTYEANYYFAAEPEFSREEYDRFRRRYGRVRSHFKMQPDRHRDLRRWLDQARITVSYDVYLARSVRHALVAAVFGLLVGGVLAYAVARGGGLAPLADADLSVSGGVGGWLAANRVPVATLLGAGLLGAAAALGTWGGRYYAPRYVAAGRRRNIDFLLPHAIVFMYALSEGGMSFFEVLTRLSDADDAYGAVADEFDTVRRDIDLFGSDIHTALQRLRNLTPSDSLEQFLDDLITTVEAGGDLTTFFEEQSDTYLERAREEQEDFVEGLGILSEVFIVGFVATPLFLVVILLVISVLGGATLPALYALVYAGMPLGMAMFMTFVATVSAAYSYDAIDFERADRGAPPSLDALREELAGDPDFAAYERERRLNRIRSVAAAPLKHVREDPRLVLLATVPAGLSLLAVLLTSGGFDLTLVFERPIRVTTTLFVVPFLVVVAPFAFFYEYRRGVADEIARRFPDTLNILASANNMGVQLTDAFEIVTRWTGGRFGDHLRVVRNDIRWNADTTEALKSLATRVRVPQVSRTVLLVAEGTRSTGNLSRILSVAAEDTRNRYRIARDRKRAMTSYVVVVVIGYLVYLLVVVLLDSYYLSPIETLATETTVDGGPGLPTGLSTLPVDTYRMIFFHSALIQGIGTGLLTGQLADGDVLSGLKYSILLTVVATVAFHLL